MRDVVLVIGLSACNQAYGLDQTQLPPPDAAPVCPALGGPAPTFSRVIYQALTQQAASYHFNPSGTLAVAATEEGIYVGRVGEPLELAKDILPTGGYHFEDPHPSPNGERLYIQLTYDPLLTVTRVAELAVYERTNGSWRFLENLPMAITMDAKPSTVFRGPSGDRIILNGLSGLEEHERINGVWTPRGQVHDQTEIKIEFDVPMAVTSDGLRAVYLGGENMQKQMMYTDRENLDSWFRVPQPLVGVPKIVDPQFTDDCARIYYTGFNVVFYSLQQ